MRKTKLVLFFLAKMAGLFHLARWLTRGRLKILCYHGFVLADEAEFRPKLFIDAERFEKRLATLRRYKYQVLELDDAVRMLYSGSLPQHTIVITVDDGFHSFYKAAVPCLKRYRYPATVYVSTYYVEHANPIFRLAVQYMFWKTRRQYMELRDVCWGEDRTIDLADAAQRETAAWECIRYGESRCAEDERCAICEELGRLLETPYQEIVQSRIFHLMTPQELISLGAAGVEIGLHTHRHNFPENDRFRAELEITDNRAALSRWGTNSTNHFCYPSGLWDERQWQWLDSMHVKSSATCLPGLNSQRTPRHALRRFLDGANIDQLEFEAAICGFSDLLREWAPGSRLASKLPRAQSQAVTPKL